MCGACGYSPDDVTAHHDDGELCSTTRASGTRRDTQWSSHGERAADEGPLRR